MASWMVHLRIAEKLLSEIEGLNTRDFLVGNIAPDCGEPNKDWTSFLPSKDISHIKLGGKNINAEYFYCKYLNEKELDVEKYSFYLGYYVHLLTDLIWVQEIHYPTKIKFSKEFSEDEKFIWTVKKDWYDLDHLYLRKHPEFNAYREFERAKGYINEHLDFFSKEAFSKQIEYITKFYNSGHDNLDRAYVYLTEEKMNEFVDSAVEKILGRLDHKWADIQDSEKWRYIELINKGWSGEKKYYIETVEGDKYLLRLAELSQYNRKKKEFEILKDLKEINFTRPLLFGTCCNETLVFTLYTWMEGNDLEQVLPGLDEDEQYKQGYQSGLILKKFHTIKAPADAQIWEERFNKKIDKKITMYEECKIKVEGAEAIIEYLNKNRQLLESRPQTFQHGDYHVGNMVIDTNKKLGIIDLNRYDYGDPWEEFNRIVWCAQLSPAFARGQLDGYFDSQVPDAFWRLLALYIGSNLLSSIPWAIDFGEAEVEVMVNQIKEVLKWYDGYCTYIPSWYDANRTV